MCRSREAGRETERERESGRVSEMETTTFPFLMKKNRRREEEGKGRESKRAERRRNSPVFSPPSSSILALTFCSLLFFPDFFAEPFHLPLLFLSLVIQT